MSCPKGGPDRPRGSCNKASHRKAGWRPPMRPALGMARSSGPVLRAGGAGGRWLFLITSALDGRKTSGAPGLSPDFVPELLSHREPLEAGPPPSRGPEGWARSTSRVPDACLRAPRAPAPRLGARAEARQGLWPWALGTPTGVWGSQVASHSGLTVPGPREHTGHA